LTSVTLQAGYRGTSGQPGTLGVIFKGHSTQVVSTRAGADWETRILASSGILASEHRTTRTFPANFDMAGLIKELLGDLKQSLSDVDMSQVLKRVSAGDFTAAFDQIFKKPFAFEGRVMSKIDDYMRPLGFELSEQDGKM